MATQKRGKPDERQLMSTVEIARITGMTEQWIRQLTRDGIISAEKKKGTRGRLYDQVPTIQKIIVYYQAKAEKNYNPMSEELAKEKLSREGIKREMEELKLAELKGDLHRTDIIERVMGAVLTRLRINLLAIPKGVAPSLRDLTDTNEIAEKIDNRIRKAMNEVVNLDLNELVANWE